MKFQVVLKMTPAHKKINTLGTLPFNTKKTDCVFTENITLAILCYDAETIPMCILFYPLFD